MHPAIITKLIEIDNEIKKLESIKRIALAKGQRFNTTKKRRLEDLRELKTLLSWEESPSNEDNEKETR